MSNTTVASKDKVIELIEDNGLVVAGQSGEWYPHDEYEHGMYIVEFRDPDFNDKFTTVLHVSLSDWEDLCERYYNGEEFHSQFHPEHPRPVEDYPEYK